MKHKFLGLLPFVAALALTSCNFGGGNNNNPDKPGGNPDTSYPDKPGGDGGDKDPDKPGGGGNPDKPGGGGEDKPGGEIPPQPEVPQGEFLDQLSDEMIEQAYKNIKLAKTSFRSGVGYTLYEEKTFIDNKANILNFDRQENSGHVDASTYGISHYLDYRGYTSTSPYEYNGPHEEKMLTYTMKGMHEDISFRNKDNPSYTYENYDKYTDSLRYQENKDKEDKIPEGSDKPGFHDYELDREKLPRYKGENYLANDLIKTKGERNIFKFDEEFLGANYNKEKVSQLDRFFFEKDLNRKYLSLKILDKFVDAYKNRVPFPDNKDIYCDGFARKTHMGSDTLFQLSYRIGEAQYYTDLIISKQTGLVLSFKSNVATEHFEVEGEDSPYFKETKNDKGIMIEFYEKPTDDNDENFEEGSVGYEDHFHDDTQIKQNKIAYNDINKYPLLNLVYEKQYK